MTYDMEGLLKLSEERYLDIVGKDTKLKHVSTSSLPEETKKHKSRAPCPGDPKKKVSCPWCSHEFDPDAPEFYKPGTIGEDVSPGESARGALAPSQSTSRQLSAWCDPKPPVCGIIGTQFKKRLSGIRSEG